MEYMCVCMCVTLSSFVFVRISSRTRASLHVCMYMCVRDLCMDHAYTRVNTYKHVYVYTFINVCVYMYIYTYMKNVYTLTRTHAQNYSLGV